MESPGVFLFLTVILVGSCAAATGRAVAESWKPWRQAAAAAVGLAMADRFLVYALFEGELLSITGFLLDLAVLMAIALLAWRLTHVTRVVRQYPWRYRRTSPIAYEEIGGG